MLEKLGNDNDLVLSEEVKEAIVQKISFCLPFFLQIMFEKISYLHEVEGVKKDINIVDAAYKLLIDGSDFNTWIERIDEQYRDNAKYAFMLLKHICQENQGSKRENLVNVLSTTIQDVEEVENVVSDLLYMLKNDGYLI